jgi:hypothetical protein
MPVVQASVRPIVLALLLAVKKLMVEIVPVAVPVVVGVVGCLLPVMQPVVALSDPIVQSLMGIVRKGRAILRTVFVAGCSLFVCLCRSQGAHPHHGSNGRARGQGLPESAS